MIDGPGRSSVNLFIGVRTIIFYSNKFFFFFLSVNTIRGLFNGFNYSAYYAFFYHTYFEVD